MDNAANIEAVETGAVEHFAVVIVSETLFVRDSLAALVRQSRTMRIAGLSADLDQVLAMLARLPRVVVLLDAALPHGTDASLRIRTAAPHAVTVVFSLDETVDNVVNWAEAGMTGYIPRSTPLDMVMPRLSAIMRGEQVCCNRVTAGLLHRLAGATAPGLPVRGEQPVAKLTARELEIIDLICAGLSNKEIARQLRIGLATAKAHVHNLLAKLNLQRRGEVARHFRGQTLPDRPLGVAAHIRADVCFTARKPGAGANPKQFDRS